MNFNLVTVKLWSYYGLIKAAFPEALLIRSWHLLEGGLYSDLIANRASLIRRNHLLEVRYLLEEIR